MPVGHSPPLSDPADVRFRLATVKTGCWLTFALCAVLCFYIAQTWSAGHRVVLTVIVGCAVALAVVILTMLPLERIVAGRWRETFFMSWSFAVIAAILAARAFDPLPGSPLTAALFLPLLFAAISYPVSSALVVACTEIGGYLATCMFDRDSLATSALLLSLLVWTAWMCLWQALNRNAQRRQLEHDRDELAQASRVDPLTGALNRRGFNERLAAELADAGRSGRPLALAMVDLDDFKSVNDRQGHAAGDSVLVLAVDRIATVLRPMDAIGRLGGDEFAVLLPGTSGRDAASVIGRLRDVLEGCAPASFGLSSFPADGVSPDELYRRADETLYEAKSTLPRGHAAAIDLSWATALADAVDGRMGTDHGHSVAVCDRAAQIAVTLGWSDRELGQLRLAATLHDIGKVAVPDRILQKPGPLTVAEFAEIRRHSVVGAQIVERISGLEPVAEWIRHSHEHYDGSGYPDGLAGDAIPPASRILLVADAFDAMVSGRPYREPFTLEEALAELEGGAGGQFDPQFVQVLAQILDAEVTAAGS